MRNIATQCLTSKLNELSRKSCTITFGCNSCHARLFSISSVDHARSKLKSQKSAKSKKRPEKMESTKGPVRIAIEGCGHGKLDDIYASVRHAAQLKKWPDVDLVIICGDFQAVRNAQDLNTMAVPPKYRQMGDFWKYYSGKLKAPYLTIFIGGNHEASGHLRELYYGGWVAPNIYYMGAANVLRLGNLRIAGLSGIWKGFDYRKGHFERLPFNQDEVRSFYHVRELDVRKMLQIRTQVDIGLSHDWPHGIEWLGNHKQLFKYKSHFEEDARNNNLGNKAATYVLDRLRPPHWFSAHMHCRYTASKHFAPTKKDAISEANQVSAQAVDPEVKNEDEIDLDLDAEEIDTESALNQETQGSSKTHANGAETRNGNHESTVSDDLRAQLPASFAKPAPAPTPVHLPHPAAISNTDTRFLALDKLEPNRQFLQLLEVKGKRPTESESNHRPFRLTYDSEWLAIIRAFNNHSPFEAFPPDQGTSQYLSMIQREEEWIQENLVNRNRLVVPNNFEPTAEAHGKGLENRVSGMPREYSSPQTRAFCEMLEIKNWFHDEEDNLIKRHEEQSQQQEEQHSRGNYRGHGKHSGGGRGRGYSHQGRGRGRGRGPRH